VFESTNKSFSVINFQNLILFLGLLMKACTLQTYIFYKFQNNHPKINQVHPIPETPPKSVVPLQTFLFTAQKREFFYNSGSIRSKQVQRIYECVYVSAIAT